MNSFWKKFDKPAASRRKDGHKEQMKTDIEIAQEAEMLPITEIAKKLGMEEDDLELYGKYKAKLSEKFLRSIEERPKGKLHKL